ncbi:hypothetical protein COS74_04395 [bacterium CG06_land_8_20_14_3_00_33_50]|nr:MAG: hypothetical protein COS74_04395 [bacterium CG06_land_8_20_14_3_00_33_50]
MEERAIMRFGMKGQVKPVKKDNNQKYNEYAELSVFGTNGLPQFRLDYNKNTGKCSLGTSTYIRDCPIGPDENFDTIDELVESIMLEIYLLEKVIDFMEFHEKIDTEDNDRCFEVHLDKEYLGDVKNGIAINECWEYRSVAGSLKDLWHVEYCNRDHAALALLLASYPVKKLVEKYNYSNQVVC